ncbi:hybrid sensor histidine kinase/response regulator [Dyella sp.]|uniref:hybrid sensor histidine kinase/response regulator n=1 Tax=Dyella sp. TaxID=1869338 RepID=UPI0039C8698C
MVTRSDRYKDQFLAILAHELRNPLTPLRMGLDILNSQPSPERAQQIHAVMDRQLVHLVRLVDDLLDVSRVSQGKIVLKKERIPLSDIIQSAVEAARPLVDSGRHALRVDMPVRPMWVNGDRTRLAQVVGNLLSNAAKYTPPGGKLSLEVHREGQDVRIVVIDNGLGIPLAMQSKIFELFTQVGEHTARAQGGLGIGLALVKQFVAMHDGSIAVQSDGENTGSRFTVRLPLLAEIPEGASANAGQPVRPEHPPRRILVVDDNEDVAETIGWLLSEMGHEFRLVHDGREACDAAREFKPDAVLLDIGMPQMDGYAVCRAFREDPALRDLPVIAQSGWGQEQDKNKTAKAGFDHHIVKPVGYDDLERALTLAIQSRRIAHPVP